MRRELPLVAAAVILAGCLPNLHNTGRPSGQTCLVTHQGNFSVPGPDFVMDGYCVMNGSILIGLGDDGLVVDNSLIRSVGFAGAFHANDENLRRMHIEDSEIDCQLGEGASGINGGNYSATRIEIRNCENGLDLGSNVQFSASLIHEPDNTDDSHADGVQGAGFDNVVFEWNTVDYPDASGAFQFHSNIGDQNANVVVRYNRLLGGAAALRLPGDNPNCRAPRYCGPWAGNQVYGNRIGDAVYFLCSGDPGSIAVWGRETGSSADSLSPGDGVLDDDNVDHRTGRIIPRSACD